MFTILAQATPPNPAPSIAASATVVADEATQHLHHRLATQGDNFLAAVCSVHFYIELAMILVALAAAWGLGKWLRERITKRIVLSPPAFIDADILTKPLLLLGPGLALVFLLAVQVLAILFDIGGNVAGGVFELAYAYLLIRGVFLIVRSRPIAYLLGLVIIINAILHALRINRSVTAYLDSIAFDAGKYHLSLLHLLHGFVIFVLVFWGAGLLSRTLESYLSRTTSLSHNARELTVKFFRLFVYLIALVITLSAVGIDLTAFAVFSGALGVGVGLGLQKLTSNFLSGVTMLMEKSIKIGDIIEVAGNTGWVRQLNIRYALIETFDGREIMIPNEELISTRVINWTMTTTLARAEINVTIDFAGDAEKANALLLEAAREHSKCLKEPAPNCYLKEITGSGFHFVLTFWISDIKEGRNGPQSDVLFSVLKKFQANGIAFAKTAG